MTKLPRPNSTEKPWCTCLINKQDGYRFVSETNEWVHRGCGKLSRLVFLQKLASMSKEELERILHNDSTS